ncbi:hypothetical protein J6590_000137 [Homalodisca vitripennis]|nr:hypothetical protein J6590_000137 [Homalodisca vitripennis]
MSYQVEQGHVVSYSTEKSLNNQLSKHVGCRGGDGRSHPIASRRHAAGNVTMIRITETLTDFDCSNGDLLDAHVTFVAGHHATERWGLFTGGDHYRIVISSPPRRSTNRVFRG